MYMYTRMYVCKWLYNIYGLSDRWDASHRLSLSPGPRLVSAPSRYQLLPYSSTLTWNVYMPTWDPVAPPALHHTSSTHLDILCPHRTLSARSLRHLSRSSSPISAHKSRTSAPNPQLQSLAYVWCDTRWSPNRRPWAPLHPCHKFTWSWI